MKNIISRFRRLATIGVVVGLVTMIAVAQAPKPSSKGLVIKGKTPISKEVLKVKLP